MSGFTPVSANRAATLSRISRISREYSATMGEQRCVRDLVLFALRWCNALSERDPVARERVAATRGRGAAVEIAGIVSRRRDTPIETPTSRETRLAARRSLMFRGFNRRGETRETPKWSLEGASSGHVQREGRDGYNVR